MKRLWVIVSLMFLCGFVTNAQIDKNQLLISSILNGNIDSVKLLLKQGANPNYENIYGITPLLFAVEQGDTVLIKILLDKGADMNIVPPYDPPAVSFAVINFKDTVLRFLLRQGANPNIVDQAGRTPLYYAIRNGNYQAADMLLFYGANPDTLIEGWTPLQLASYYNDTLLINMLVYYGADVNRPDTLGLTPLHVAAQFDNLLAAKVLLSRQARMDLLSKDLASPVDIAIYTRSHKVFDYLMGFGPSFDNFIDGRFDAYQVAVFQQNYHARHVLSQKGLRTPMIDIEYFVRLGQLFNTGDYMPGVGLGIKELFSGVSVSFDFYRRLFSKRIIIPENEHVYYQYWETRWALDVVGKKAFYLFHLGRLNNYLELGGSFLLSYATYRGTLMTDITKEFVPAIGYSFDYNRFSFEFLFTYFDKPLLMRRELYVNAGVYYRLPTTPLKIRTKKKILY